MAYSAEDILTLARAGFNAKQIGVLLKDEKSLHQLPRAEPVPAPEPAPTPAPAPAPTPAPTPAPAPAQEQDNAVAQRLDDIMKLIQSSNIVNSQQPKEPTIDDIVAEIISPKGDAK